MKKYPSLIYQTFDRCPGKYLSSANPTLLVFCFIKFWGTCQIFDPLMPLCLIYPMGCDPYLVLHLLSISDVTPAICLWCYTCDPSLVLDLRSISGATPAIHLWCYTCDSSLVLHLRSISGATPAPDRQLYLILHRVTYFLQVLYVWFEGRPSLTVGDLMREIQVWYKEGFLYDDVWETLREYLHHDVIPTQTQIQQLTRVGTSTLVQLVLGP